MITNKAMLVRCSIGIWDGSKRDRELGAEVAEKHGSEQDMFSVVKKLVPADELSSLTTQVSRARIFHKTNTLPWYDGNIRILPSDNYLFYMERMNEIKNLTLYLVHEFCEKWDVILSRSKNALNGAFELTDYPTKDELERKFHFDISVFPIPDAPDFRVDLEDDEVKKIKDDLSKEKERWQSSITEELWSRFESVIDTMITKLEEYNPNEEGKDKKAFNRTLIDNTTEILQALGRMNVNGDSKFDSLRKNALERLTRVDAKTLREDDSEREKVIVSAKAIKENIALSVLKN